MFAVVLQASPVLSSRFPPFSLSSYYYDMVYGGTPRHPHFGLADDDPLDQLYEHQHQLDLQSFLLQSYPTSTGGAPSAGDLPEDPGTSSVAPLSATIHPRLGQTLMLGSLESGLSARHRRCSSPGSFLHMIREDVTDCPTGGDDLWPAVGDLGLRKTSLALDDSSPVGDWSRKTSSTSGYSDMTDSALRKLSTASEEEKLSIYSSLSRKTSGASEDEQEYMERFLRGLDRSSKSRGRRSNDDEGVVMLGEDALLLGPVEGDPDFPKSPQADPIPTFQLVIHKADSEDSNATVQPDEE